MMSGINFSDIAKEFREESLELLDAMENSLINIRENGMDDESINAVFRAAHTIKGTAGMYKIDFVVEFTHIAENLLDQIRNGKIEMNDELGELLLECKDHMQNLVEFSVATNNEKPPHEELSENTKRLGDALNANLSGIAAIEQTQSTKSQEDELDSSLQERSWNLKIKFNENIMEHGFEPASFLAYLRKNSSSFVSTTKISKVPLIKKLEPTNCYVKFKIDFTTTLSKEEIIDVFEFVEDDCTLNLNEVETPTDTTQEQNHEDTKTHETTQEVKKQESGPKQTSTIPKIQPSYTIRVDAEKIDLLINLIGEMVVANANVVQQSIDIKNNELTESVSIVSRMLEDIRENAMQIRMVQIGETFNRFKRIIMDLSKKLGKDIELVIKGGETELDKTVIEKITDPLVHIVRNAIDHGIEEPENRGGKNVKGTVQLNAYHDAGTVVIEISDDGKGLDKDVLYTKAVEKGLIEDGVTLSEQDIFKLILEPGFSTAPAVTDLSGRGVGMDVVKRNIEALRGNIEIQSKLGEGTQFIIRLPLTLAIIDGFLVQVGETSYVIPLDMVVECIELSDEERKEMHGNNFVNLRGTILPLLNVGEFFNEKTNEDARTNIIVVHYGGKRYGFIVEELYGEFQTVIKPLGKIFSELRGISGATILGSGKVALILDVPLLVGNVLSRATRGAGDEMRIA
ncbi:chemotaxis protein CheA [Sulfurimonas sp.]|uniref:chemotaxis protein CheA n=1 Tax=Sulfurimonas sp. TaxID=2022749 RepID=UPI003563D3C4